MVIRGFDPNPAALSVGLVTLLVFTTPRRISQWIPSPLLALVLITPLSLLVFPEGLGASAPSPGGPELQPSELAGALATSASGWPGVGQQCDRLPVDLPGSGQHHHTRHRSDRELVGQGIANTVAGLFNGSPVREPPCAQ